jgi:hypothetical protein
VTYFNRLKGIIKRSKQTVASRVTLCCSLCLIAMICVQVEQQGQGFFKVRGVQHVEIFDSVRSTQLRVPSQGNSQQGDA